MVFQFRGTFKAIVHSSTCYSWLKLLTSIFVCVRVVVLILEYGHIICVQVVAPSRHLVLMRLYCACVVASLSMHACVVVTPLLHMLFDTLLLHIYSHYAYVSKANAYGSWPSWTCATLQILAPLCYDYVLGILVLFLNSWPFYGTLLFNSWPFWVVPQLLTLLHHSSTLDLLMCYPSIHPQQLLLFFFLLCSLSITTFFFSPLFIFSSNCWCCFFSSFILLLNQSSHPYIQESQCAYPPWNYRDICFLFFLLLRMTKQ
jgi:hypothetical protein